MDLANNNIEHAESAAYAASSMFCVMKFRLWKQNHNEYLFRAASFSLACVSGVPHESAEHLMLHSVHEDECGLRAVGTVRCVGT